MTDIMPEVTSETTTPARRQYRYSNKIVDLRGLRFGIEIEFVGVNRDEVAKAICSVVGGTWLPAYEDRRCTAADGRKWMVVTDGSLSDARGGEIVSPILVYPEDMDVLQKVIRAAREAGAKVDSSCGVHVHLDRPEKAEDVVKLARYVARHEDLILRALAVDPRRLNYAGKMRAEFASALDGCIKSWDRLGRAWYGRVPNAYVTDHKYDQSRYAGLNLHSCWFHKTVEFRYFNGTLHAGKIRAYVEFCGALYLHALGTRHAWRGSKAVTPGKEWRAMWTLLVRIGLIGEAYETARLHLLEGLRPARRRQPARREVHPGATARITVNGQTFTANQLQVQPYDPGSAPLTGDLRVRRTA